MPLFDLDEEQVDVAMRDVRACREAHPQHYVKLVAYDRSLGRQTSALSFIVNRPDHEPGFRLERQEKADRQIRYTLHPYATDRPAGRRYAAGANGARPADPAA
jgi:ribulose-bisphosphate carboxylase small chain